VHNLSYENEFSFTCSKSHLLMKGSAPGLALKKMDKTTQKQPTLL